MARRKSNPLHAYEPSPQDDMDYALDRAVEKAILNHPQTKKLKKVIEAEMKKATKAAPKAASRIR